MRQLQGDCRGKQLLLPAQSTGKMLGRDVWLGWVAGGSGYRERSRWLLVTHSCAVATRPTPLPLLPRVPGVALSAAATEKRMRFGLTWARG